VIAVPVLAEDDVGVRLSHDLQDLGRVGVTCGHSVRLQLRPLRIGHRAREARMVVDGHRGLLVGEHHDAARVVGRLLDRLALLHAELLRQVDVGHLDAQMG